MKGLEEIERNLDSLVAEIPLAAEQGLQPAVTALMQAAEDSRLYNNRSGATRGSTIAYVAGSTGESGGVSAAAAVGDALITAYFAFTGYRPRAIDRVVIESVEPLGGPDSSHVILTALMEYDEFLFTVNGGAKNALGEALTARGPALAAAAFAGISELFG